ncbi:ANTAR domain-containing response regulator [Sodalis sp. RH19]|uniref:ANTAR domain-containing response regulator n=1 Tax=unclassified Sodalis (in: enterobacteria) TaxID=2636512 RepID=UPI0039B4F60E
MKTLSPPDFDTRPLLLVDCDPRTLATLEKCLPRMGGRWVTLCADGPLPPGPVCAALVELEYFASPRTLEMLRQRAVPIVVLTSHEALSQIQRALVLGATALLPKPINQRAIYTTLMMAIGLRHQLTTQEEQLMQLRLRVSAMPVVSRAVAALMVDGNCDEQQAWAGLRGEAMRHNLRMEEAAEKYLAFRQQQRLGEG